MAVNGVINIAVLEAKGLQLPAAGKTGTRKKNVTLPRLSVPTPWFLSSGGVPRCV